jgi:hypothetical protein
MKNELHVVRSNEETCREFHYTLPCGSFSTLIEMLVIDVSSILEFLLTIEVDDKVDDETEDMNAGPEGDVATSIFKNATNNLRKITLSLIVILY